MPHGGPSRARDVRSKDPREKTRRGNVERASILVGYAQYERGSSASDLDYGDYGYVAADRRASETGCIKETSSQDVVAARLEKSRFYRTYDNAGVSPFSLLCAVKSTCREWPLLA